MASRFATFRQQYKRLNGTMNAVNKINDKDSPSTPNGILNQPPIFINST
jgi:hypothetical protein